MMRSLLAAMLLLVVARALPQQPPRIAYMMLSCGSDCCFTLGDRAAAASTWGRYVGPDEFEPVEALTNADDHPQRAALP